GRSGRPAASKIGADIGLVVLAGKRMTKPSREGLGEADMGRSASGDPAPSAPAPAPSGAGARPGAAPGAGSGPHAVAPSLRSGRAAARHQKLRLVLMTEVSAAVHT